MTLKKPVNLLIMATMVLAMALTFSCAEENDDDGNTSSSSGGDVNNSSSSSGGGNSSSSSSLDEERDDILGSCMARFEGGTKGCLEYALGFDAEEAEEICADKEGELNIGYGCPEGYVDSWEPDDGVTAYEYPPEPIEPPELLPVLGSCVSGFMKSQCIEFLEDYDSDPEEYCAQEYGDWSTDGCAEGYYEWFHEGDMRIYYYHVDPDDYDPYY